MLVLFFYQMNVKYDKQIAVQWDYNYTENNNIEREKTIKKNGATCASVLTKVKYFTVTPRHVSPHMLSKNIRKMSILHKKVAKSTTRFISKFQGRFVNQQQQQKL